MASSTLVPSVSIGACRVCALMGVLVGVGAGALASEGTRADALIAGALDIPISDVLGAAEIEMDGVALGVFGRGRHDDLEQAAIVSVDGSQAARLGSADEVWFAGLVDLEASAAVPLGRRTPRRLSSAGLARPALVMLTRYEELIEPRPGGERARPRRAGVRESTHLFLVELYPTLRVMVSLELRHRSEDGFGGHVVAGTAIRQLEGTTYLEAVRQDHLPASRARCRKPDPYPVRFELDGSRFRRLPVERPEAPCG